MKSKFSIVLLLVLIVSIVAILAIVGYSTPIIKADLLDDASDLCLILHKNINTNVVDWTGFYKCVGTIMGWI